jgi:hypothetical protein
MAFKSNTCKKYSEESYQFIKAKIWDFYDYQFANYRHKLTPEEIFLAGFISGTEDLVVATTVFQLMLKNADYIYRKEASTRSIISRQIPLIRKKFNLHHYKDYRPKRTNEDSMPKSKNKSKYVRFSKKHGSVSPSTSSSFIKNRHSSIPAPIQKEEESSYKETSK